MNSIFNKIIFTKCFSVFFITFFINCREIYIWNDCFIIKKLVLNENFQRNLDCLETKKNSEYKIFFPNGISFFSSISIANKKIPVLEDFLFADMIVGSLKLSHNEIEFISKYCFKGIKFIAELDLSYNKLNSLNNISFSLGLTNLTGFEILNVDFNQLEHLNLSFSGSLKKLNKISLRGNRIKFICENFFIQLSCLRSLNLGTNFLSNITEIFLYNNKTLILKYLYLQSNNFSYIQSGLFNNLTETKILDLSSNYLENLHGKIFDFMTNLLYLSVKNNSISQLDKSIFKNLYNIEFIDLSYNKIETIPESLFNNLINLNFIKLNFNKIKSIEKSSFVNLNSIDIIDLNNNLIEKLNQDFILNSSDPFVNLKINNIKIINNQTLSGFRYQAEIILYSFNIKLIESYSFFSFKYTKKIFFNGMGIERMEQYSFIGLDILNLLRLDSNKIYSLEKNTFDGLSRLKSLNLSRNNIITIENEALNGLNSIENLYLCDNFLDKVPNELNKLTTLKQLDVSKNLIKRIETNSFKSMKNLKSLVLDSNQIFDIKIDGFNGLEALENLSISNNRIEMINKKIFINLKSLKKLILLKNKIMNIDSNSFGDNTMFINLAFNSIFEFNFNVPKSLIELNLESNEIESIDFVFFNRSKNLTNLNFANNKLHSIQGLSYANGLKYLNLEKNRLKKLPKSSHNIALFEYLNLNSNQLNELSFLEFTSPTHLYVSNNNISYFDNKIFENLIEIDLSNNPIMSPGCIFIDKIYGLQKINLANITSVIALSIDINSKYDKFGLSLNLSNNNFQFFKINTDLIKLNELTINNFSLDENFDLLESISDVTICHLSNYKGNISRIFEILKTNLKLLILDISFNNITSIDFLNSFLSKPISLNLKGNFLKVVTKYHLNIMEDVENLDFSHNFIQVFSLDFKLTPKLKSLYLQNNQIKIFNYFNYLFNIREINLSFNQIESIGDYDFDPNVYTLEKSLIDLSNNRLKNFNLETAFVKEKYETITYDQEKNSKLIILLNNNCLKKIDKNSFETFNLVELNLGFNFISEIHQDSFYFTINLEILKLNNNKLKFIDKSLFKQLNRLNYLDLSNNFFEYFDDYLFNYLFQLKYLNLSKNNILLLNQVLFSNLKNLLFLNLTFNENLIIEKNSFSELKLINHINLDLVHVKKFFRFIGESLKNQKHDRILETNYYKSIRLIVLNHDLIDCEIIFYFLKKKILCNIENDKNFNFVLDKCKNMILF